MTDQQLDLFSSASIQAERPLPQSMELRPAATALDDQALIAAIPESNLADCIALATEAGRRRLAAAVPSLEALCRRFSGFGIDRMVPEQAAALQALAVISGREAAQAVSQLMWRRVVQGPALSLAASTAARIGSTLPTDILRSLLRHPDPGIRASACGCARRRPELISVMIDLLDDLNQGVARSAAVALRWANRRSASLSSFQKNTLYSCYYIFCFSLVAGECGGIHRNEWRTVSGPHALVFLEANHA